VTLAREIAPTGVTVNGILPRPFDTDMARRAAGRGVGREDPAAEDG
jgi:NAD(P)-dependent dehydrogenase (short-subunit alcohol dehydrogenase family)